MAYFYTSTKRISLQVPRPKSAMIYRDIDLKSVPRPKSAIYRDPSKKVKFSLGARLRETGEMFVVPDCNHNMRIRELKNAMELVVGIPTDFQRVCYLDNGQINTFDVICWFNCWHILMRNGEMLLINWLDMYPLIFIGFNEVRIRDIINLKRRLAVTGPSWWTFYWGCFPVWLTI